MKKNHLPCLALWLSSAEVRLGLTFSSCVDSNRYFILCLALDATYIPAIRVFVVVFKDG